MKEYRNYSLLAHNTFGIDARCRRFVAYEHADEASQLARSLTDADLPLLIIGGGSNLLLTHDFEGTVVRSAIRGMEVLSENDSEVLVRVGSGENWDQFVATCVERGWYGAENLSLIPGDVGASAVQNIGAYGAEAKDVILSVDAVEIPTGQQCVIGRDECAFGYRQSRFKQDWKNRHLITHVTRNQRQVLGAVESVVQAHLHDVIP